jgi:hypothetical protein
MPDLSNYTLYHTWRREGQDFCIEVQHCATGLEHAPNRWNVYAYVYPKHVLFKTFNTSGMFQDACQNLPFHGGCTYIRFHGIDSVQVGADYQHLYDNHFAHYKTPKEASEVFRDAENLFLHLTNPSPCHH